LRFEMITMGDSHGLEIDGKLDMNIYRIIEDGEDFCIRAKL